MLSLRLWLGVLLMSTSTYSRQCRGTSHLGWLHDNGSLRIFPSSPGNYEETMDECLCQSDRRTNSVLFPSSSTQQLNQRLILQYVEEVWVPVRRAYKDGVVFLHDIPSDPEYNRPVNISNWKESSYEADCMSFNLKLETYKQQLCEFYREKVALCVEKIGQVRYVVGPVCPPGTVAIPAYQACFGVRRLNNPTPHTYLFIASSTPSIPACDVSLIRDSNFNTEGFLHRKVESHTDQNNLCIFYQITYMEKTLLKIELDYNRTSHSLIAKITHSERLLDISCYTDAGNQPYPVPVTILRVSAERAVLSTSGDGYYWCVSWDVLGDTTVFSKKFLLLTSALEDSPDAVLVNASLTTTASQLALGLGISNGTLQVKRKLRNGFLLHVQPPIVNSDPNIRVVYVRNTRSCPSVVWFSKNFPQTVIGETSRKNGNVELICSGDYNIGGYWEETALSRITLNKTVVHYGRSGKNHKWNIFVILSVGLMAHLL